MFAPVGKNPTAGWKLAGGVGKVYERTIRSYAYAVEGGATSRMHLPKDGGRTGRTFGGVTSCCLARCEPL